MAQALRKLLRSSDHREVPDKASADNVVGNVGATGSPAHAARRLLAKACSSVHGAYRDAAKVCPVESGPLLPANHNNNNVMNNNNNSSANKKGGGSSGGGLAGLGSLFRSKKSQLMSESTLQHARMVRTRRLMKEFQEISRQQREYERPTFTAELVDDNLFDWNVKLHQLDPESELYRDMQETGTPYVLLNLTFPDNFPFAPPFMRVIAPRIEKGFVMEGGAICMELLTPRGWASAYTVEAVIMQFAASLVKGQARIARKLRGSKEFSRKSAEASFRSLVKTHEKYGWVTPPLADG